MALTDDQKAMLRLLAQREEGYEDMAALMGLSVEEVRAKVKEALADLAEGEQPEPAPSPPAEKAATPAEPPIETAPQDEAPQAAAATAAPAAEAPPPPPPAAKAPAAKPRAQHPARPQLSLPEDRGARIGLIAGVSAIVLVVVLLATGVLGGGDDSSGTDSSEAVGTEAGSQQLTQATLEPTDGSDASGRALFGRAGKQVVLQVEAQGLDPSPQGQSYVVWLARSPQQMLPLAATKVDDSGEIVARYQVPTEVLGFLAGGTFDQIAITLIADDAFRRSVAQARKQSKSPAFTGTEVLRGEITGPIVGLARREKEAG